MEPSQNGMHLTELFEQFRDSSYQDIGGVWTIAWGHTRGVGPGMNCTREQGDLWLKEDYATAVSIVNELVDVPLTQGEFDALCDFVFNLGGYHFSKSTLLRLLNSGNYSAAAAEFDKWDYAAGKRCAGLLRRREAETQEFNGANGVDLF